MPPADRFGLVGQVLDGHFRVDRYVGEGGFSIVYKGTHIGLSEPIAIKCLKLPAAIGSALVESFVKRFRDESRLHYKLSQGNLHIVRSIASGTTIAPATSALVPFTVLEWLEGLSLAEELAERRASGLGGRPLAEVVRLLDSAIVALAHAHAQGVVHRDLNPGNLFLARTPEGTKLKVLDFGVAKILADSALAFGPSARTLGDFRMFTPAYGAPEQFDERVGPIGPWTDVYAVALVVLEALVDRTIMQGEHIGELATRALDEANRPTPRALGLTLGAAADAVLARAVAVRPAERPQDAGELWGTLKNAMNVDSQPSLVIARGASRPPVTLRVDALASQQTASDGRRSVSSHAAILAASAAMPAIPPHPLGSTVRMPRPQSMPSAEGYLPSPLPPHVAPGSFAAGSASTNVTSGVSGNGLDLHSASGVTQAGSPFMSPLFSDEAGSGVVRRPDTASSFAVDSASGIVTRPSDRAHAHPPSSAPAPSPRPLRRRRAIVAAVVAVLVVAAVGAFLWLRVVRARRAAPTSSAVDRYDLAVSVAVAVARDAREVG